MKRGKLSIWCKNRYRQRWIPFSDECHGC